MDGALPNPCYYIDLPAVYLDFYINTIKAMQKDSYEKDKYLDQ